MRSVPVCDLSNQFVIIVACPCLFHHSAKKHHAFYNNCHCSLGADVAHFCSTAHWKLSNVTSKISNKKYMPFLVTKTAHNMMMISYIHYHHKYNNCNNPNTCFSCVSMPG